MLNKALCKINQLNALIGHLHTTLILYFLRIVLHVVGSLGFVNFMLGGIQIHAELGFFSTSLRIQHTGVRIGLVSLRLRHLLNQFWRGLALRGRRHHELRWIGPAHALQDSGQEWVQTNMAAQALNTYRQFKEKTAQDAYDYVISQGGTPEQAAMARTEVARGFARSELATTAMTPIGPARTAAAIAAPAREAGQLALTGPRPMLALPPPSVPRVSPTAGSAADIARSRAPQSLDEMRAALGLPPSETVRTIEAMPTTTRPSAGSPADIARNRPVQSLEEQRAALGLPTAEQAQINEAIRIARERAAIEAMPVNVSPTVGSAAQRGMEVNREFANMTNAQRRASVGLPPQTQAELEALDLARMATEGPIPEKVYRMPDAVSGYRRAVNDRYEPMPRRPVQAEVVTMPESLAGTTAESRALATRPGLPTTAGGSQELVSYGPFNSTINAPGGGSRLPPGVAGAVAGAGVGGLGAGGLYLATRFPCCTLFFLMAFVLRLSAIL